MALSTTTFGNFELFTIETGDFRLDGGAMFGVVPKTLWSRGLDADELNRIPMTMRCLLIRSKATGKVYLIDNGAGNKFNEKMTKIYDMDYSNGELLRSLKTHGFSPEDVTDIIFTHLHFDHCGGTTDRDAEGNIYHVFPKATYHVHEDHWNSAMNPNVRESASFLPENIGPIRDSGRLHLVADGHLYEEGLSAMTVTGHTDGQQLPVLSDGSRKIVFAADLIPTHHHVPLAWVMGYDMRPAETLTEKEAFLTTAAEENWYLYLEHDQHEEMIQIDQNGHKFAVRNTYTLNDL